MANRVSNVHSLEELLEYLAEHPGLAKGIGLGARSKETVDKQWNELATKLNSYGSGSSKSGERWKKYWADIKHKSKARLAKRRRDALGTGGGPSSQEDLSEVDKKVLAIIGDQAIFGDIEYRIPVFNTQLANVVQTVTEPQEVLIKDNGIEEKVPNTLTPNSPSTRGQTSRIYTSEIPVTYGTRSETQLAEALQTGVQSPVSRPSADRSSRYSKHKRVASVSSQSRIQPEWVMELERNRVEAEKKLASAALIMADASRVQAEAARVHTDSMCMLVELVRKQSAEIRVLLSSLNQNSTGSAVKHL